MPAQSQFQEADGASENQSKDSQQMKKHGNTVRVASPEEIAKKIRPPTQMLHQKQIPKRANTFITSAKSAKRAT
jgi:hypothetical protein